MILRMFRKEVASSLIADGFAAWSERLQADGEESGLSRRVLKTPHLDRRLVRPLQRDKGRLRYGSLQHKRAGVVRNTTHHVETSGSPCNRNRFCAVEDVIQVADCVHECLQRT